LAQRRRKLRSGRGDRWIRRFSRKPECRDCATIVPPDFYSPTGEM
jgi:hypothetical protein